MHACVSLQQRRRCCIFLCCFNVRSASAQPLLTRESSKQRKKSLRGLHVDLVDDNMPKDDDDDDTCSLHAFVGAHRSYRLRLTSRT